MTDTDSDCDKKVALIIKDIQSDIIENNSDGQVQKSLISRQNVLIGSLVDVLLNECGLQLANSTAESRVRETIQEMMEENVRDGYGSPVSRFRSSWPELSETLPHRQFTILIPLPVSGEKKSLPREIKYNGQTIKQVSSVEWGEQADLARTTQAEDTSRFPDNLDQFTRGTNLGSISTSRYTFWRFDDEGIDADYVLQNARTVLDVLLGQLSLVADSHTQISIDYSQNQVQERMRTTFRQPPFYLIFCDSEFYRIHPGTYPVETPIPRIKDSFDFENIFGEFCVLDEFNEPQNSIYSDDDSIYVRSLEATLGSAISTFGKAMREDDPESMFLWLYRTLEHATFTKHTQSRECLERALRILDLEQDSRLNDLLDAIKNKRNTLVHDGTDIEITQSELNLLKSLTTATINSIGHSGPEGIDVIVTKMIMGDINESIESTTEKISKLESKLQILEKAKNTSFYSEE